MNNQVNYAKIQRIQDNLEALTIGQFGTGFVTDAMLYESGIKATVAQHTTELVDIVYNVKSLGCMGDGTTDDTTMLQNIFTNATSNITIYFPKGTYLISSALTLNNANNITILGSGKTKIKQTIDGMHSFSISNSSNITIASLDIDGSHATPGQVSTDNNSGVYANSCTDLIIKDCYIHNRKGNGINVINSTLVKILNNTVDNTNYHPIVTNTTSELYIYNNKLTGVGSCGTDTTKGGIGILCTRGDKIHIYKNYIYNTSDTGTKTEGSTNVTYEGNYIENAGKDGIKVQGYGTGGTFLAKNCKIINNTVKYINYWRSDGSAHIMVDSCDGAIVQGNYVIGGVKTQGEENGIKTFNLYSNNKNVIISSNNIVGTYLGNSINIVGADNIIISDNFCEKDISCNGGVGTYKIVNNNVGSSASNISLLVIGGTKIDISNNDLGGVINPQPSSITKNITIKNNNIDYNGTSDVINITNYSGSNASLNMLSILDNSINLLNTTSNSNIIRITCTRANYDAIQISNNFVNLKGQSKSLLLINTDGSGNGFKVQNLLIGNNYPLYTSYNTSDVVSYKGMIYLGTSPTSCTWEKGDRVINSNPAVGQPKSWICTVSGTQGTLNSGATTGSITTGTNSLAVNSAIGLYVGMYITIVGVTGIKRITTINGTTITIDSNANATVTDASIAYSNATFVSEGNL